MSAVHLLPFDAAMRVRALPMIHSVAPAVEARVAELWQVARARQGSSLVDGKLFSIATNAWREVSGDITGTFVAYRYYVAQRLDPSLEATLNVRPLGVTGAVFCAGALLIGKRVASAGQDAGCWEIMPSGGVEPGCLRPDGYVDPCMQLRQEMHEEVGLEVGHDLVPRPLTRLTEGTITDLVYRLDMPLGRADVTAQFSRLKNPEHTAIAFVEAGHIHDELTGTRNLSASCRALLTMLADGIRQPEFAREEIS